MLLSMYCMTSCTEEKGKKKSSQDGLSQREKEIIACVVKG